MRIYSCIPAFLHVENVGQDPVVAEIEETEAEGPEQQLQESEVAKEDTEFETNLSNPDLQQGKPQFILTQSHYIKFKSYSYCLYLCIYVIRSCLIPRCMW